MTTNARSCSVVALKKGGGVAQQSSGIRDPWLDLGKQPATTRQTSIPNNNRSRRLHGSEKKFLYKGEETSWNWNSHGFRLRVPKDALPPGVTEIWVTVTAAVTCEHTIPPNTELVSGVYAISSPHAFTKPVTLEIEHSCLLESPDDAEGLFFVHCMRDQLPCHFQVMEDGIFETSSKFGRLNLDNFSIFSTLRHLGQRRANRYCTGLYFSDSSFSIPFIWHVYLVITKDIGTIKEEVKKFFQDSRVNLLPNPAQQLIKFDGDKIYLLSSETSVEILEIQRGWKLRPITATTIFKEDVDSYVDGLIPHCHLSLTHFPGPSSADILNYTLMLNGAKPPSNFFLMHLQHRSSQTAVDSPTSNKEDHPCTEECFTDLFKELLPLASKWHNIGVFLSIPEGSLEQIKVDYSSQGSDECLREMIKVWLKMIDPEPTWERLATAIGNIDQRKAEEIRSKYTFSTEV